MNKKIERTVTLKCTAGKIEEFKLAAVNLIKETEKEPGCLLFKIFQKNEIPDEFILWEIYENEVAKNYHLNTEYTKNVFSLGLFELTSVIKHQEIKFV